MINKKLSLKYNIGQWEWIMGNKIQILKPLLKDIQERFPNEFRVVSVMDLKTALMSLIDDESIYQDLLKRAAYGSTNSQSKL